MRAQNIRMIGLVCLFFFMSCLKQGENKKSSKTFYTSLDAEPTTLNPVTSTDGYASAIKAMIFDSLLDQDPDTQEWTPALAASYSISKDNKVFEFKMRPGAKWQDGKDVTVEDVKFSFDIIFDPEYNTAHLRPLYENISKAEIVDSTTIRFYAKDDYFQNFDVVAGISVLPKHFYGDSSKKKEFNRSMLGSGPYKIKKYDKGKKIVLEQNKEWWGRQDPKANKTFLFKNISYRFVAEDNVKNEMMKKGDLDFLGMRPETYMRSIEDETWKTKLEIVRTENKTPKGYCFIGWNLKNDMFSDVRVRKALAMLLNRDLMREKFEHNLADKATGPIYVQSDYASPKLEAVPFNPTEALKIFNEAGWKDSNKDGILDKMIKGKLVSMSFTILEPFEPYAKYLTVYKEDAKKVGVDVNIKIVEWNTFSKLMEERKFEALRLAWGGGGVDVDLKQVWHTDSIKGGSNFISFSNKRVDTLIEQARKTYDRQKRIELTREADELIAHEYPYAFFFNSKYSLYGNSKRIIKPKDTFVYGIGQNYWTLAVE